MTGRQSYILGCDFAIHQLTKKGSEFYVVHEGDQYIQVAWNDILEWLEKEYNKQEPFINKPCVSSEVCEHDKNKVLEKIRAEIREWYWQADKQELAKDPCVVDAMIDLFIRTIAKYQAESEK